MTNLLLDLINQYPWLIYVLLGIVGIILLLVIYILIKGGEVSLFGLKLSRKQGKEEQLPTPQHQQQTQTVNVQTESSNLSQEQIKDIARIVSEEVIEYKREVGDESPTAIYPVSKPPERIEYMYSVRYAIERKVRSLVLSNGGPWAGSSMATINTFLDYGVSGKVFSKYIAQDIHDFLYYTQTLINSGGVSDGQFLEMQYQASKIIMQLDSIPMGPLGPEG